MTLTGRLAITKRVDAGTGVSYGHRYTTSRETTLGLVPLGYADGIPRLGTNLLEVWAAGRRRRIAGTVCMDQFVVDVGDDEIRAGDEVILFGPGDRGEPTAQDWADLLGTISYEIVTQDRCPRPADLRRGGRMNRKRKAGLVGAAIGTAGAIGVGAAVAARRYAVGRDRPRPDPDR